MLTFLSLLAVILGAQPPQPPEQPRLSANAVTPALPELRALPSSPAPVPLVGAPPSQAALLLLNPVLALGGSAGWQDVPLRPQLSWWGRRQTDGG